MFRVLTTTYMYLVFASKWQLPYLKQSWRAVFVTNCVLLTSQELKLMTFSMEAWCFTHWGTQSHDFTWDVLSVQLLCFTRWTGYEFTKIFLLARIQVFLNNMCVPSLSRPSQSGQTDRQIDRCPYRQHKHY